MSFLKKLFFAKKTDYVSNVDGASREYSCDVSQYDATYEIPRAVLRLVGLRLTRKDSSLVLLFWNVFYWFEFLNLFVVTWLELINMVQTAKGGSFQEALQIFRMMPCVGYLLMAQTKSYKIVYYRSVYENLVSELRSMWPQGAVSKEEHIIIENGLKQLYRVVKGYYWCNNALLVVFLSPPFVEIIKRQLGYDVPLILPFFYWFPFDPFQKIYYEIVLAFQTWHGYLIRSVNHRIVFKFSSKPPQTKLGLITIWFMLCSDLLFCIFMSHITTQFDLLAWRVEKLVYVPVDKQLLAGYPLGETSATYWAKDANTRLVMTLEQWEQIYHKDLISVILRHQALIRLAGDVEAMFSFALLVNFLNSSIVICFCGFCCVIVEKWNEMIYKSFLTTALSQTWLLCWYGQRLLESSEGVALALYNSGWYQTSKKIRSSMLIMLHRSQKVIRVTTYGFSIICLESYTTIIKTAWSYFTLLLNVYKD